MGLIGIIVGFVVANVWSGGTMSIGAEVAPTAPLAPTAPTNAAGAGVSGPDIAGFIAEKASAVGVDADAVKQCLDAGTYEDAVSADLQSGTAAGVNGTPGNVLYNLKTKTAWLIPGAQPIDNFQKNIDAMLLKPNVREVPSELAQLSNTTLVATVEPVDFGTDHVRGDETADIAIIEYSDFQCPFCQRVHSILRQVLEKNDGKIMWIYRHFPLSQIHPNARKLAEGSECVAELGGDDAFWKYTDKVFEG